MSAKSALIFSLIISVILTVTIAIIIFNFGNPYLVLVMGWTFLTYVWICIILFCFCYVLSIFLFEEEENDIRDNAIICSLTIVLIAALIILPNINLTQISFIIPQIDINIWQVLGLVFIISVLLLVVLKLKAQDNMAYTILFNISLIIILILGIWFSTQDPSFHYWEEQENYWLIAPLSSASFFPFLFYFDQKMENKELINEMNLKASSVIALIIVILAPIFLSLSAWFFATFFYDSFLFEGWAYTVYMNLWIWIYTSAAIGIVTLIMRCFYSIHEYIFIILAIILFAIGFSISHLLNTLIAFCVEFLVFGSIIKIIIEWALD
ncbi:MAG: hypothetical protein ACTSR3_22685 [Candidatus Helarchaeota archaeon]